MCSLPYSLKKVQVNCCEKRQVFDVPQVRVEVAGHQVEVKNCPQCGTENRGKFPEGVTQPVHAAPSSGSGDEIKTQLVYFNHYQMLPLERTAEVPETLYGHTVHPKRGHLVMDALGILPDLQGRAMQVDWMPDFKCSIQHGLCNAHHLRRLKFPEERCPKKWGRPIADLLVTIKKAVEKAKAASRTGLRGRKRIDFERVYDRRVKQVLRINGSPKRPEGQPIKSGQIKQSPAKNLLDEFKLHKEYVLACMHDFKVSFDNNQAERDIRMMKVRQKVSGCFRSLRGAEVFCRIRGYISTTRKNGQQVLDVLRLAYAGTPYLPEFAAISG